MIKINIRHYLKIKTTSPREIFSSILKFQNLRCALSNAMKFQADPSYCFHVFVPIWNSCLFHSTSSNNHFDLLPKAESLLDRLTFTLKGRGMSVNRHREHGLVNWGEKINVMKVQFRDYKTIFELVWEEYDCNVKNGSVLKKGRDNSYPVTVLLGSGDECVHFMWLALDK